MTEQFDQIYDRRGYNCIKWSRNPYDHPDFIPMGIADMDIATPDFVIDGIRKRLDHPMLGYFRPDERFFQAILGWQKEQYGTADLSREDVAVQTSVLGGVASAVRAFTEPGDGVLVQAPGYFNFAQVIKGLGRRLVTTRLVWDGEMYRVDLEQMERQAVENHVKAFLLCSPHNPTGRVWSREELEAMAGICRRHGIPVIADEIWADLVFDKAHIPFHSVSEWAAHNTISLYAPTKTFNMAGITIAYSVVKNPELRERFERECQSSHYNLPNLLSAAALTAAYESGAEWKEKLCAYLKNNTELAAEFFHQNYPGVIVPAPQGTYLLWLDFRPMGLGSDELLERFGKSGLYFNDGRTCIDYGDGCLRMNAAMPRPRLLEVFRRIGEVL